MSLGEKVLFMIPNESLCEHTWNIITHFASPAVPSSQTIKNPFLSTMLLCVIRKSILLLLYDTSNWYGLRVKNKLIFFSISDMCVEVHMFVLNTQTYDIISYSARLLKWEIWNFLSFVVDSESISILCRGQKLGEKGENKSWYVEKKKVPTFPYLCRCVGNKQ